MDWRESPKREQPLTPAQAQAKAEAYCAFQERSQQEVRNKLYTWGLYGHEVENIISELIATNYLNEERFAIAYATGRFRMKGWGKIKIKQGLAQKSVSKPLVKIALKAIDMDEYHAKLLEILTKKAALTKEDNPYIRKNKLARYAVSRGFEPDLVYELLNDNDL